MITVGKIGVHEFITLDGVIGDPSWSFDYSFDPKMAETIGEIMGSSQAILLGRRTYQEFASAWSTRTAEEDPGAPFMNEAPKYVVSASLQAADWDNSSILGPYSAGMIRDLKDPGRWQHLRQWQRDPGPGTARRRPAPVRLPAGARRRSAAVRRH